MLLMPVISIQSLTLSTTAKIQQLLRLIQQKGRILTAPDSDPLKWPLSDTEPLGEPPSSEPSGTGEGGWGGGT